jgi:hypothetical protein
VAACCCSYQPHWNRFFRHSCIFSVGIKTQKKSQMVFTGTVIIILLGSTIILPLALNYDKFSSGPQFQSSIYEKEILEVQEVLQP